MSRSEGIGRPLRTVGVAVPNASVYLIAKFHISTSTGGSRGSSMNRKMYQRSYLEVPAASLKWSGHRKRNVRRVSAMFFRPSALSSLFCTESKTPTSEQPIQSHHVFMSFSLWSESNCGIAGLAPVIWGSGSQSCGPGR